MCSSISAPNFKRIKVDAEELSNISISVKNHTTVFAAEKSRIEGRVVELSELNR
ncbi:MAG: hypothetical protein IJX38_00165 [Clostridia bacterium]|nr:hypothetical protein [Clostridia bacterium]